MKHISPNSVTRFSGDLERGRALTILDEERYLGNIGLAGEFMDYVDQHSGLLIGRGGDIGRPQYYGFPHRTFQEYLAGCYLVSHRDATRQILALTPEGDYWSTAVQLGFEELCFNRLQQNDLLDFAYRFCTSEIAATVAEERKHLWASNIAVLLGVVVFEQDSLEGSGGIVFVKRLRSALVKRLSGKLPPIERALAGRNLAELGDPRPEVMTIEAMQFCHVPGGPFIYQGEETDSQSEGFWLGRYPVTNAQYQAFIQAGGYLSGEYWKEAQKAGHWKDGLFEGLFENEPTSGPRLFGGPFGHLNHPVVGVSWYEALAFCRWLTDVGRAEGWLDEGNIVGLPSEQQWEKAARGGLQVPAQAVFSTFGDFSGSSSSASDTGLQTNNQASREYPWGDEISANLANYADTGIGSSSALGCFPSGGSPYGCEEMAGTVWEWCRSKYEGGEEADASGDGRVLRGGSWGGSVSYMRCSVRSHDSPFSRASHDGFRLGLFPING